MQQESNELVERFEKMIESDTSIFLDTDEIEEIILYYFNDGDISMAERAIELGNNLYPKSININILHSEILLLKGDVNKSYELIENLLDISENSQDLIFQKAKILNKMKKYMESISILKKKLSATHFMALQLPIGIRFSQECVMDPKQNKVKSFCT